MTCAEFEDRLSAYSDGELSRWKRWKVQIHLRQCRQCSSLLGELRAVDEGVAAALHEAPAPEYLTGAVMRRLPALPPAWQRRGGLVPWAAGLAVAGMQVLALYGVYNWGYSQGAVGLRQGRLSLAMPSLAVRPPQSSRESTPERTPGAGLRGAFVASPNKQYSEPQTHLAGLDGPGSGPRTAIEVLQKCGKCVCGRPAAHTAGAR